MRFDSGSEFPQSKNSDSATYQADLEQCQVVSLPQQCRCCVWNRIVYRAYAAGWNVRSSTMIRTRTCSWISVTRVRQNCQSLHDTGKIDKFASRLDTTRTSLAVNGSEQQQPLPSRRLDRQGRTFLTESCDQTALCVVRTLLLSTCPSRTYIHVYWLVGSVGVM